MTLRQQYLVLLAQLLTAAILYFAFSGRFYVGYFNDDAVYIIAAKPLAHGRYTASYLPGAPPLIHFPPGYPALLAPFVWLLEPHWAGLKIVMAGLALWSGFLVWKLSRLWLPANLCLVASGAYLFNPTTAMSSGSIMADSAFLCFTLVTLLNLHHLIRSPSAGRACLCGFLLGWTALMRPNGPVLILAVAAGLAYGRRWRLFNMTVGIAALCVTAFLVRNWMVSHALTDYAELWPQLLDRVADRRSTALNALWTALFFFCHVTLGFWTSPEGFTGWLFCGSLLLAGLVMGAFGIQRLRSRKTSPEIFVIACLFCIFNFLLYMFWPPQERHFLPMLPLAWIVMLAGADSLLPSRPPARMGSLLVIAILYFSGNRFLLKETLSAQKPIFARLPQETFAWIRDHTPIESLFLSKPATLYLYTKRHGIESLTIGNPQEFRRLLKSSGVNYVFYQERNLSSHNSLGERNGWEQMHDGAEQSSQLLEPIYRNTSEGTLIYRLRRTIDKDT